MATRHQEIDNGPSSVLIVITMTSTTAVALMLLAITICLVDKLRVILLELSRMNTKNKSKVDVSML